MEVTLLGTGDAAGTPVPRCDCATCERARSLDVERTRFSVHVRNERTDESLLVDFSPDFRHQFLREDVPLPDAGVVTHVHYDHLAGLGNVYRLVDDLPVLAADGSAAVEVPPDDAPDAGPDDAPDTGPDDAPDATSDGALEASASDASGTTPDDAPDAAAGDSSDAGSVAANAAERYDYLDALRVRGVAPLEPVECCGFEVTLVPVDHPPLPCYGLRIEDPTTGAALAMTGDTTYAIPERSRAVLADADLLLADGIVPASYCAEHPAGGADRGESGTPRTFGTKHLTLEGARALADELDAGELRVVHCSHRYPVEVAFDAPLAVDGERVEL